MSWGLFKANILRKTSVNNSNTVETVAKVWAEEYVAATNRGKDFLHFESIQTGNKELMESLFKVALLKGMSSPSDKFSLVNEFGNGVKAYWMGAQMKPFPIPLIPAPGSIQNIAVNSNIVSNVGTWPMYPPIKPVEKQETLIDMFILAALVHLFQSVGLYKQHRYIHQHQPQYLHLVLLFGLVTLYYQLSQHQISISRLKMGLNHLQ